MAKHMSYLETNEEITNKLVDKANYELIKKKRHIPISNVVSKYAKKDKPLLEIGAREGNLFLVLKEQGFEDFFGLDACEKAIGRLRGRGFDGEVADAQNFSIDKKFDTVIISHTLEHCPEPDKVIGCIYKHLEDDGVLYVEVPLQTKDVNSKLYKSPTIDGHYHRFESVQEFMSFFDSSIWDCIHLDFRTDKYKGNLKVVFVKGGIKFPKTRV